MQNVKNGGNMRKFFILITVSVLCAGSVNAQQLVLSDIIQQARDAQMREEAKQKAELAMMQPVTSSKDKTNRNNCEQNAIEKINPDDFMQRHPQNCPNKNSR